MHEDCINIIIFAHNGEILASGSSDKAIKLWDLKQKNLLTTFHH